MANRIGDTLGKENWREAWQRGLTRRVAKKMGDTLGKEDWQGGEGEGKEGEGGVVLIRSSNPHLAGWGEKPICIYIPYTSPDSF